MAKWYEKALVQTAIVIVIGGLVIAFITVGFQYIVQVEDEPVVGNLLVSSAEGTYRVEISLNNPQELPMEVTKISLKASQFDGRMMCSSDSISYVVAEMVTILTDSGTGGAEFGLSVSSSAGLTGFQYAATGNIHSGCNSYSFSFTLPVSINVAPRTIASLSLEFPQQFTVMQDNSVYMRSSEETRVPPTSASVWIPDPSSFLHEPGVSNEVSVLAVLNTGAALNWSESSVQR